MKPKIVRVKDGYDFNKELEEAKQRRVSRRLNFLVLFLRAMMIFNAMNMVAASQSADAPLWLYFTYQPLALATIGGALLLGKRRDQRPVMPRKGNMFKKLHHKLDILIVLCEGLKRSASLVRSESACSLKMSFSERYELGQRLEKWVNENGVAVCGMGYISALNALGFEIIDRRQEINLENK